MSWAGRQPELRLPRALIGWRSGPARAVYIGMTVSSRRVALEISFLSGATLVGWLAGAGCGSSAGTVDLDDGGPSTHVGTGSGSGGGDERRDAGVDSGSGLGSGSGTSLGSGSGSGSPPAEDAGPPSPDSALPPVTGTVGITGGSVSRLYFASTGDTRPSLPTLSIDTTTGYPTSIIDTIFSDIAALSPPPSFVVTTGDYQFALSGEASAAQLALYMAARAKFAGPAFFAMGNHECSPVGLTTSNCGAGNPDGLSANYTSFLTAMLTPIQQTNPYYTIKIDANDGSWTSKFVFVAANAWDSTQQAWLTTAMAEATTYTFVVRHEATDANTAPGVTPSEAIVSQYPITLEICGHTHDYSHTGNRVVLGNGGAPLTGTGDYGFGTFQQRADGAIVVDEVDYLTGAIDPTFHFVVKADGTLTM